MKDQITHLPDNADRSAPKQKFTITTGATFFFALITRAPHLGPFHASGPPRKPLEHLKNTIIH
ncbi:hypothetical protein CF018_27585 (plasmid) [Escherichia coli]|nr:hypothetical protein CF018_27585 [Escherichia coli]